MRTCCAALLPPQAQLTLDNEQFMSLLRKLDDCKAYVVQNTQYADSSTYTTKFRQLQVGGRPALAHTTPGLT